MGQGNVYTRIKAEAEPLYLELMDVYTSAYYRCVRQSDRMNINEEEKACVRQFVRSYAISPTISTAYMNNLLRALQEAESTEELPGMGGPPPEAQQAQAQAPPP
eukprot:TRINITY_DN1348_c0_g1_i1.p2 TRINITY_DN1348_c0_g1~~TRINITY_DN1348_c0_g1_i1.p2  ORF type:complete len:104 (-),score=9.51 TRINITY_DN1348_c0_g1_i1:255-566(-)